MSSEKRQRNYSVHVRLTVEEFRQLRAQADEWNEHLPPNASMRARMTIPRILVAATFRREIPHVVVTRPAADAALVAELKALRSAVASSGNMLKTWLRYGKGAFSGKGTEKLEIAFSATGGQVSSGEDLLRIMSAAHRSLIDCLEKLA